jgi:hypothetical protein
MTVATTTVSLDDFFFTEKQLSVSVEKPAAIIMLPSQNPLFK